jgi:hypothetical protein
MHIIPNPASVSENALIIIYARIDQSSIYHRCFGAGSAARTSQQSGEVKPIRGFHGLLK